MVSPGALEPCLVASRLLQDPGSVRPPVCREGRQWRRGRLDRERYHVVAAVVDEDRPERLPYTVPDLIRELGRHPGINDQDGLAAGLGPVVPRVGW
jgi:hypothetical protein